MVDDIRGAVEIFCFKYEVVVTEFPNKTIQIEKNNHLGIGIALGAGIGTALGVALGSIAIGIAIGTALGAAVGAGLDGRSTEDEGAG